MCSTEIVVYLLKEAASLQSLRGKTPLTSSVIRVSPEKPFHTRPRHANEKAFVRTARAQFTVRTARAQFTAQCTHVHSTAHAQLSVHRLLSTQSHTTDYCPLFRSRSPGQSSRTLPVSTGLLGSDLTKIVDVLCKTGRLLAQVYHGQRMYLHM